MKLLYEDCFDCKDIEVKAAEDVGFEVIPFDIRTCCINDLPSESFIFRGSLEGLAWLDRMKHPHYIRLSQLIYYSVSEYSSSFGKHYLNSDFIILPAGKIKENKELIFKCFEGDRYFIKPNSGDKLFTGTTLTKKWFDKEIDIIFNDLNSKTVADNDLIMFSSYKHVGEEIRSVIVDDCVLTNADKVPDWFSEYIEQYCFEDAFYTADFCGEKLVEINSISCSGFYDSYDDIYFDLFEYLNG